MPTARAPTTNAPIIKFRVKLDSSSFWDKESTLSATIKFKNVQEKKFVRLKKFVQKSSKKDDFLKVFLKRSKKVAKKLQKLYK